MIEYVTAVCVDVLKCDYRTLELPWDRSLMQCMRRLHIFQRTSSRSAHPRRLLRQSKFLLFMVGCRTPHHHFENSIQRPTALGQP